MTPRTWPLALCLTLLAPALALAQPVDGGAPPDAQPRTEQAPAEPPPPTAPATPSPSPPVAEPQAAPAPPPKSPEEAKTPAIGQKVHAVPVAATVEWGKGVTFKAGDLFSLQLRSRIQVQATAAVPTDGAVAAGAKDEVTDGILIRRARLVLSGHAFTPKLQYYFQLGFSTRDQESDLIVPVRDAYLTWQPLRDLGIRFGQMKVPYGKQRVVSSSALQFVDRSIVTGEMNLDRDVGLYLMSEDFLGLDGRLNYQVGVFSGLGRNRAPGPDTLLVFGRIQINPFGKWEHLVEADIERLPKPRLAIGLGAVQNLNSNRTLSTFGSVYTLGRYENTHLGADIHFKWRGFSLLSEVFYRDSTPSYHEKTENGVTRREYARSALGFYAQAGFVFPRLPFELAARYGEIRPKKSDAGDPGFMADPAFSFQREIGGALSFYFWEHSLKLQTDYFFLDGDDPKAARHQWRLQAQIYF